MVAVNLDSVYKYYGNKSDPDEIPAVDNLNLKIEDGEFVAILGPSGCGKSTTMRMIAGLEHISSGSIKFGDKEVNLLPPKDRDIAMVFENYALYPHKTVFDNIANPLKLAKVNSTEIKKRVREATTLLEIDHLLDRRPQELSGGQKQRVAIGRAIVRQPQVFLFDEPIAHLDAKLRARMRSELKHMQMDFGITSLYVTHDQLEALSMADRVAVMHEGVLQQFDAPRKIYEKPANAWVATFVGEPQMSLLEGEITNNGTDFYFNFKGNDIPLSGGIKACVEKLDRSNVILGVRPNQVSVTGNESVASFQAEVYSRQLLGGEILLEVDVDGIKVRSKAPLETPFQVGEKCFVTIEVESCNLFSYDNGNALY